MKLTFPHIGDAHLVGRILFSELGIEIVTPPYNTISGMEKGSEVSPDEICLPFKLMVSNLMAAHAMGADTVVMPATMGPCRLGEYGELLKSILDKRGYHFRWILLDSPKSIGVKEFLRRLSYLVSDSEKKLPQILSAVNGSYRIIKGLEKLEQKAHLRGGYEEQRGSCKKLIAACRRDLSEADSIRKALGSIRQYHKQLDQIKVNKTKTPLHLLMAGEIYSMIEPFANHHMEELLMDMGVSFEKRVTLGWWIDRTIVNPLQLKKRILGNRYMPHEIGGYAKDTVAEGILCARKGYDGVIQVFPVGCMPEIVAKSVFGKMMKENRLSVLTVIYDEMGGEAGYITRIEAFVDMLSRRKRIEENQKRTVLNNKKRGKINVLPGH